MIDAKGITRANPQDLGWRRERPGATVETDPSVYETMRSFVDAQGDADLPLMRRLEEKLRGLGWTPPVDFRESLERTVRWTLAHPSWLMDDSTTAQAA